MDPEPGGRSHKTLLGQIEDRYRKDDRIRAIVVFGSVGAGTWHELSDVDLDVVTEDGVEIVPPEEITALFGPRAVIVLAGPDAADVVLDSAEELSVRWHPLGTTSPNIIATARIVAGTINAAALAAAGQVNWSAPDEQRLLDTVVRDAVGGYKNLARGRRWEAVTAVERMRRSLTELRGGRDALRLDPADPARALAAVLAEAEAGWDLGGRRQALLRRASALVTGLDRDRLSAFNNLIRR